MNDLSPPRIPGLRYYPDSRPGIARRRCGKGFVYVAADGTRIAEPAERARLAAIAVPPAYENVWITPHANGHLQATGRDARGRKQYIYHDGWAEHRALAKYDQLADFGRCLPRLRSYVARSLRAGTGSVDLAVGAVLALIDRASIRVGNSTYMRENRSFGATTLLGRHVRFGEDRVRVSFRGKGGKLIRRTLAGRALQAAMSRIHDLPGAVFATWIGEDGEPHAVTSERVNAVIAEICGEAHTAKTFRTWNGTHAAFCLAMQPGPVSIRDMATCAAERLGNTPAVARSSYIHPAVIALAGTDLDVRQARMAALATPANAGLRAGEAELIGFLDG
ncbi:DNA topoisomerase IB [Frigidibacter sp. SD6-1]|uniref:DNA topoisomerase IB n=1 Tax=Frigidibacter sp. SD6-1 TaxID=3032581 RepID=UPI0024E03F62|nr:DNA topoisomerase IB [Frigidibacter sp. SD6-1]